MKKALLVVAVIFGMLVLFVPLISRPFLIKWALHQAEELLQTKVELSSAELHLLSGGVVVRGLRVYHPDRKDETIMEARR